MVNTVNKLIVTDIDAVCLDYVNAFIEWVEEEYKWILDPHSDYNSYSMESWFVNPYGYSNKMSKEEFMRLITEYNSYPRCIPPVQGSQDALKRLKHAGYKIVALSSFGGTQSTQRFRRDYLEVLFPKVFDDIILLNLGECKKDKLKELKPRYFIEDCTTHAESGVTLGIPTFLLDTTYNQDAEGVMRVNNWAGIIYLISELDNYKEVV